ncbi:MAG: GLPGLI family protein [Flavobacteriaceae bacterium]
MKYVIYLSTLLFFCTIGAQNKKIATKVTYESQQTSEYLTSSRVSQLIYKRGQSKYVKGEHTFGDLPENATMKEIGREKDSFYETNYVDLQTQKIHSKLIADNKIFLVEESLNRIPWEIKKNETDSIMGFSCLKAIGEFRGRQYTAWFTPEIPVPFGPWKLNGLPGLILEARDERDEIKFAATKIEYLKKENADTSVKPQFEDYDIISLKDYVEQKRKDNKEIMKRVIAKMPKGSKISGLKENKHSGLELKYEWEEN